MKTLEDMSKDERSLLIYFESRSVDNGGTVDTRRMNDIDMEIAKRWNDEDFISFGRICFEDTEKDRGKFSHWCSLSDEAFGLAHSERKARSIRLWEKRNFSTTSELRGE